MTPSQYLLFSIKAGLYTRVSWILSVFTVTVDSEAYRNNPFHGQLIREPFGLFYLDEKLERQPIDAKVGNTPLIPLNTKLTLDPKTFDFPFIGSQPIETTATRLLLNMIAIFAPFDGKIPYINSEFEPKTVEKIIGKKLTSMPKDGEAKKPDLIYIDELVKFTKAVAFLEDLGHIFAHSVTQAGLYPPPGRREFRAQLLKKYEGKLTDPIQMAHYEKEMSDFDAEYLKKNDPSYGYYINGKVKDARKKRFLTQGGESNAFVDQLDTTPIVKSLDEGIDLSVESFVAAGNMVRYGSYSRGTETVNGGVAYKAMAQALDAGKIIDGDCGSKFYESIVVNKDNTEEFIGRYMVVSGKPVLVTSSDMMASYVGKLASIRSPAYCILDNNRTCEVCAGKNLAMYRNGQVVPAAEISAGVLNDSLKKMHNTGISTKEFSLEEVIL